jgi:hypothetical protein
MSRLLQEKNPPPPIAIEQDVGRDPEAVWTLQRRNISCLSQESNGDSSVIWPVAESLYRLGDPGHEKQTKTDK